MSKINKGDLVELKSGGMDMVVTSLFRGRSDTSEMARVAFESNGMINIVDIELVALQPSTKKSSVNLDK